MLFIMILMLVLVVIYILVQQNFSDFIGVNYNSLENRAITALKKYKKNNDINIDNNEEKVITIKQLKQSKLLKNFECSGYGLYKKKSNKDIYEVYLNCGKEYVTDGYLRYLDEA